MGLVSGPKQACRDDAAIALMVMAWLASKGLLIGDL